jgi:hypothetical protein
LEPQRAWSHWHHPLRPLTSRLLGRLGVAVDLEHIAARRWTLSPEVESTSPPARFDESDFDKITGCPEGNTIDENIGFARGGVVRHGATLAYELRHVTISSGHLFGPRFFMPLGPRPAPVVAQRAQQHFEHALLTSTPYGATYFGHWILECVPLTLLARRLGMEPVSTIDTRSANQQQYLEILGLDEHIATDASFDTLVFVHDIGQNELKVARYHAMRAIARGTLAAGHRPSRGIFLRRGVSGQRRVLVNEDELASIASSRGLEVVDPMQVSTQALLDASFDTPLVVGVEGSQMLNAFPWLAPGGTMFALVPPQRFDMILRGPCDALSVRFSLIVGDARGPDDFHVDARAFARRLDEHLAEPSPVPAQRATHAHPWALGESFEASLPVMH